MIRFVPIAVLLTLTACSFAQHESSLRLGSCCRMVSSALIPFKITGYQRQSAVGPCVDAIVFHTIKGKICSNPKARWVARKIKDIPEIP